MVLNYLVTGTGRCGTVYMARLLTQSGISCGHETIFDWHGLEWAKKRLNGDLRLQLSYCSTAKKVRDEWVALPVWLSNTKDIQADSSYMAAPFLGEDFLAGCKIIHMVRHPVRVVASFCDHLEYFQFPEATNHYEQFIYAQLPELVKEMPKYDRACLFYVLWNEWIEKASPSFHRIEDGPVMLMEKFGLYGPIINDNTINTMKRPGKRTFQLNDITSGEISQRFIEQGRRYGYSMESQNLLI